MTKNVLDERPALLRRLHIPRCLHTLVERLARRTDALGVGRGRPVAVRRDHQLALRIDEDALPEDALRGEAAVVVGPPLIAIAAARHFDPRLLRSDPSPIATTHVGHQTGLESVWAIGSEAHAGDFHKPADRK